MITSPGLQTLASDLLDKARAAGADAADVLVIDQTQLSSTRRMGATERLERSEASDIGLRVFCGKRMAVCSSTDRSPEAVNALVERAVAMARVVPEDPFCGLAEPSELARDWADLDLADADEPSADTLLQRAAGAEDATLAVAGVTNSEGAEAAFGRTRFVLAATNGFVGQYTQTSSSVSVSAIAGSGTGMETDYDFTSAVHAADLHDVETVGRRAGERAVARLGARKAESARVPVVYDPRVSAGLLRHLIGAISGNAIARGTSFLKDAMDTVILPEDLSVIDDPHVDRGRRSRPFDGEGLATRRRAVVDNGRLTTWILDLRSARQLGLSSTGHAGRSVSSPPGPSPANMTLEGGTIAREDLIADVDSGLYVTQLMGMGVNAVTGDYSRGASGFWIEGGKIAYPVNEVTIAGNLKSMLASLTAATDLERRYGIDAPTLRVDGMTVAGR